LLPSHLLPYGGGGGRGNEAGLKGGQKSEHNEENAGKKQQALRFSRGGRKKEGTDRRHSTSNVTGSRSGKEEKRGNMSKTGGKKRGTKGTSVLVKGGDQGEACKKNETMHTKSKAAWT